MRSDFSLNTPRPSEHPFVWSIYIDWACRILDADTAQNADPTLLYSNMHCIPRGKGRYTHKRICFFKKYRYDAPYYSISGSTIESMYRLLKICLDGFFKICFDGILMGHNRRYCQHTCSLHTNGGCMWEREVYINWSMVICQGSTRLACAGRLSAVNAIGTRVRNPCVTR